MHHAIRKRLAKLETRSPRPGQTRFFAVEGAADLSSDAAYAFLRGRGHRWTATDAVFLTVYEDRGPDAQLRDLTKHQHGVAP